MAKNKNKKRGSTNKSTNTITPLEDNNVNKPEVIDESKEKSTGNNKSKSILSKTDRNNFKLKFNRSNLATSPMSYMLQGALDEQSRRIEDFGSREIVDSSKVLNIKGTRGKVKVSDIISTSLGDKYSELSKYNGYGFGTSSFIRQSRVNKFLEYNLPKLVTSCGLFVDDVCNGSNFGNEEDFKVQYKFYRNGVEITDIDEVSKMTSILEPNDLDMLSSEIKKCSQIDREAFYTARRDGASFVRIIPNAKIAKEMYIKYILKETKIKYAQESLEDDDKVVETEVVVPKDKEATNQINSYLRKLGMESISENTNLYTTLDSDIFNTVPKSLKKKITSKIILNTLLFDKYNLKEVNTSETFYSFAKRYLSGEIHKLYGFETIYNVKVKDSTGTEYTRRCKSSPMFTFSTGSLSNVDTEAILRDIFVDSEISATFATESMNEQVMTSLENLDIFDKQTLLNSSFESIYNMNLTSLSFKRNSSAVSFFSTESTNEENKTSSQGSILTPLENLTLEFMNTLNTNLESKFSMEANGETNSITDTPKTTVDGTGTAYKDKLSDITKRAEEKVRQYSKLDRMFSNIRGETIEFLDNTCVHPVMGGDRLMGVYYATISTDNIQNLISARNMLVQGGVGEAASVTYGNPQIDDIDLDQTMGKLMFTDYIKPIIERTISKEFIRDNIDIGHTLLKLMEENDMSNLVNNSGADTGIGVFNYTKVNFIPSDEIVFYRNGTRGLGESVFKKAEIPAHMCILLREEYLGWVISDGKGISFVTVPQGASDITGEIGMSPLLNQIDEFSSLDRTSLRNMLTTNVSLTHKFFKYIKPNEAQQDISINTLDMPDFRIDQDMMLQLEQEASELVGYNSAMFSSRDGNIELARKLFEMNGTKILEIINSQYIKKKSTAQLATTLLRIRGGEEYNNVIAVWVPPLPSKINNDQRTENITAKLELVNKMVEVIDAVYDADSTKADYELVRKELLLDFVNKVFSGDNILGDLENVYNEKVKDVKVALSTVAKEK